MVDARAVHGRRHRRQDREGARRGGHPRGARGSNGTGNNGGGFTKELPCRQLGHRAASDGSPPRTWLPSPGRLRARPRPVGAREELLQTRGPEIKRFRRLHRLAHPIVLFVGPYTPAGGLDLGSRPCTSCASVVEDAARGLAARADRPALSRPLRGGRSDSATTAWWSGLPSRVTCPSGTRPRRSSARRGRARAGRAFALARGCRSCATSCCEAASNEGVDPACGRPCVVISAEALLADRDEAGGLEDSNCVAEASLDGFVGAPARPWRKDHHPAVERRTLHGHFTGAHAGARNLRRRPRPLLRADADGPVPPARRHPLIIKSATASMEGKARADRADPGAVKRASYARRHHHRAENQAELHMAGQARAAGQHHQRPARCSCSTSTGLVWMINDDQYFCHRETNTATACAQAGLGGILRRLELGII